MKKNQFALIATAWGHKGSLAHLYDMGAGLYNRYCLGDDFSKSAKDFREMSKLCEQLKNGLYSEKVATEIKRDESPNHYAMSLDLGVKKAMSGKADLPSGMTSNGSAVFLKPYDGPFCGTGAQFIMPNMEKLNDWMLEKARQDGRSLDTYVLDFSNKPEQSRSINLETGEIK